MPAAIVTNLESFVGLQTARLLRSRGVPVVALTERPGAPLTRTRAVKAVLDAGPGGVNTVQVLQGVAGYFRERPIVLPCSDSAVALVSSARTSLDYHVALPPHDVIETLTDKYRFLTHVSGIGVPVSHFRLLRNRVDALAVGSELDFPVVMKPTRKNLIWEQRSGRKAVRVQGQAELLRVWDSVNPDFPVLAQEWIAGGDDQLYSCNAYFGADGEPLATFVAKKIRQWPPQVGVTSLGRECRNDEVLETALRVFQSVPYCGLAYLEMKWDQRTGRHLAIEANVGRPTGRSAIAETGGVELIHTAYCDAVGLPLPRSRVQRYGDAGWVYLSRDIASAWQYHRNGELTLGEWRNSVRGIRTDAVFSWDDPVPFVLDLTAGLVRVLGQRDR